MSKRSPMMPVWEKLNYYKIEIQTAETERESIKKKLLVIVEPKTNYRINERCSASANN
ncbi:MAG: hypothetical protein M3367_13670 [Acidobacteriota bacterium]|nr:hypothetical protein [Acidobacteriota bacterium]